MPRHPLVPPACVCPSAHHPSIPSLLGCQLLTVLPQNPNQLSTLPKSTLLWGLFEVSPPGDLWFGDKHKLCGAKAQPLLVNPSVPSPPGSYKVITKKTQSLTSKHILIDWIFILTNLNRRICFQTNGTMGQLTNAWTSCRTLRLIGAIPSYLSDTPPHYSILLSFYLLETVWPTLHTENKMKTAGCLQSVYIELGAFSILIKEGVCQHGLDHKKYIFYRTQVSLGAVYAP